jgi:serine/threonine protein kinase
LPIFRYYLSNGELTVKSDVFSFGVVLLEIITGRPPIIADIGGNLLQWVHQNLSGGDIQRIVDPRMQGKHDINSIWKVTNLACKCTELKTSERPTMTEVVAELKESLDLEISTNEMHHKNPRVTYESQNSVVEMAYDDGMIALGPSVR